jgi:hypothetical protein
MAVAGMGHAGGAAADRPDLVGPDAGLRPVALHTGLAGARGPRSGHPTPTRSADEPVDCGGVQRNTIRGAVLHAARDVLPGMVQRRWGAQRAPHAAAAPNYRSLRQHRAVLKIFVKCTPNRAPVTPPLVGHQSTCFIGLLPAD